MTSASWDQDQGTVLLTLLSFHTLPSKDLQMLWYCCGMVHKQLSMIVGAKVSEGGGHAGHALVMGKSACTATHSAPAAILQGHPDT